MTTLILSILIASATPATTIQETIEMVHNRAGGPVAGVFTVDAAGHVLMFERIPRPFGNRGKGKSFAWPVLPVSGICDDTDDCFKKVDELCKEAGHGGAKKKTVEITQHADGGATCSADCERNGAVAFATCKPSKS